MITYKAELYQVCQSFSENPWYNQGGGGNISIKNSETMTIKASGFRIDEVTEESGSVGLDLTKVSNGLLSCENEDEYSRLLQDSVLPAETSRPSMESGFHALISHRVVAHLHHAPSCFLLCLKDSGSISKELFPDSHWVPYVKPGLDISFEVDKLGLDPSRDWQIIFLQNHGVIVAADNLSKIESLLAGIEETILTEYSLSRDLTSQEQTSYDDCFLMPDQVIFNNKPDSRAYLEMSVVLNWIKGMSKARHLELNHLAPEQVDELLNLKTEKHRMGLMK